MEKSELKVLSILLFILLSLSLFGIYFYHRYSKERIRKLKLEKKKKEALIKEKKRTVKRLRKELSKTKSNLTKTLSKKDYLKSKVENLTSKAKLLSRSLNKTKNKISRLEKNLSIEKTKILGLKRELKKQKPLEKNYYLLATMEKEKGGKVLPAEAEIQEGDGDVSVTVKKVIFGNKTQLSVRKAFEVAGEYTGFNVSNYDLELKIMNRYEGILSVKGNSAGSAFTLLFIACLENKTIDKKTLITGTIERDGGIGSVGDVKEKVRAAKEFGAELALVPEGEKVSVSGIDVKEVSRIKEAAEIIFS